MAESRLDNRPSLFSRRHALKSIASGFGYLAFASLAHAASAKETARAPGAGLAPRMPHFPARAKRVIFLCMNGGPSHVDMFDYKPVLNSHSGAASTVGATAAAPNSWALPSNSPSTANRGCGCRKCSHISPSRPTICASSTACIPICRITPRHSSKCTQAVFSSFGPPSAPGRFTAWAARTPICPASSP